MIKEYLKITKLIFLEYSIKHYNYDKDDKHNNSSDNNKESSKIFEFISYWEFMYEFSIQIYLHKLINVN